MHWLCFLSALLSLTGPDVSKQPSTPVTTVWAVSSTYLPHFATFKLGVKVKGPFILKWLRMSLCQVFSHRNEKST